MELYKDGISKQYRELKREYNLNFKEQGKCIDALKRDGWVEVLPSPKPECGELETARRDGVELDTLGNTVMAWKEVDMFTSDLVEDGVVIKTIAEQETEYLAKLAEDAIKAKILEGETYIEGLLQIEIVKFNVKYFTKFTEINDMASYAIDTAYSLQTQCDTLIKWKNNLWDTARTNQASVLAGTMTDAEFLDALPVAPVV